MTELVHDTAALSMALAAARRAGKRIAFVPTMGALHDGHFALVDEAKRVSDFVVVSVFVNPLQFGPNEDFSRYPRTLESDFAGCKARGVAIVFAPDADTMYPEGHATTVDVAGLTDVLEGVHRPGHFRGVATVVAKLFAMIGPCTAIFGRKDYQQLLVIKRMTRDLSLPVDVVGMPTIREPSGLALSSRNRYLSDFDRARALAIVTGLRAAQRAFSAGERDATRLVRLAREPIEKSFDSIDYVEIVHADSLHALRGSVGERTLIAVAAKIGQTRLIDNTVLGEDKITA